jgi:hypothetical protein
MYIDHVMLIMDINKYWPYNGPFKHVSVVLTTVLIPTPITNVLLYIYGKIKKKAGENINEKYQRFFHSSTLMSHKSQTRTDEWVSWAVCDLKL